MSPLPLEASTKHPSTVLGCMLHTHLGKFAHVLPPRITGTKTMLSLNFEGDDFKFHLPLLWKHTSLIMFDPMWTNRLWALKASRVSQDAAVDRESKNVNPLSRLFRLAQPWSSPFFSGYSQWFANRRTLQCFQWWQVAKARASRTCYAIPLLRTSHHPKMEYWKLLETARYMNVYMSCGH